MPMADILVVDDDASVAGALRRFLDNEGHESRVSFGSELGLVLGIEGARIASWIGFMSHAEARASATGERTIQ